MAIGDYILCCECECKLIYDGDRGQREWWNDRWGKDPQIKCPDCDQPAQQEPVAHRDGFWCADLTCKKCYSADFRFKHKNSVVNESLTTTAQRTWVGLSDAELVEFSSAELGPYDLCLEVEAKLKEKNNG